MAGIPDPQSPKRGLRSRRSGLSNMAASIAASMQESGEDEPPVSPSGGNTPSRVETPQRGIRTLLVRRSGLAGMAQAIAGPSVDTPPKKPARRGKLRSSSHGDDMDDDDVADDGPHPLTASLGGADSGMAKTGPVPILDNISLRMVATILVSLCVLIMMAVNEIRPRRAKDWADPSMHGPQQRDLLYNPLGVSTRIIGGQDVADPERYPYFALFYNSDICGGALIAPDLVLTAAHCLHAGATRDPLDPTVLTDNHVWVGRSFIDPTQTDGPGERYSVIEEVPHSLYKPGNFSFDIMIVKLSKKAAFQPVRINLNKSFSATGQTFRVIGFGDTNAAEDVTQVPLTLQEIATKRVNHTTCQQLYEAGEEELLANYPDVVPQVLTRDQVCAERSDGGTCAGDSGGPLFVKGFTPTQDLLVGLVAWHRDGCGSNLYPDVYTNIHYFSQWIVAMACDLSTEHDFDCSKGDE